MYLRVVVLLILIIMKKIKGGEKQIMGKLMEHMRAKIAENRAMNAEQAKAKKELRKAALEEARQAYKTEYIKGAKQAVKARARREAMANFGYTKAEKRAKAVSNLAGEFGSLSNIFGSPAKSKSVKVTKSLKKAKVKKQKNPFDLGDFNNFNMGSL